MQLQKSDAMVARMSGRKPAGKPVPVTECPKLDFADYLPYLINRVGFALVDNFTRDALASQDLSIAMWRVLAVLSSNGEQRQIDLSELTSIDASTLSRLVTRLVELELVTRRRSRTSSREVVVELTPKGRGIVERLIPVAQGLERTAITGIPPQDLAIVRRSLRRMYENMAKSGATRPRGAKEAGSVGVMLPRATHKRR
jgi:DNA-binding MarR family transcriptional regulator